MRKYVIKTNKGYICERNDYKTYPRKSVAYQGGFAGNFFNCIGNNKVDMLGFTDDREKAQRFCGCVGNRIQEIINRIEDGYEADIEKISIEVE